MNLLDFFAFNFYWIDFSIGIFILFLIIALYLLKKISKFTFYLYWIGFLLGLCWELPMSISNEIGIYPVAQFITPLPVHFSIIVITHCFWDGGLFLFGIFLIHIILKKPHFEKFKYRELVILIIWGQLSELAVELLSTFNDAWEYIPYWWNPSLFIFNNHYITLLPQLIWLIAPIVFYLIVIKLKTRLKFPKNV